jgi:hypothetical protein
MVGLTATPLNAQLPSNSFASKHHIIRYSREREVLHNNGMNTPTLDKLTPFNTRSDTTLLNGNETIMPY